MSIRFNVPGKERKDLVKAISEITGSEMKYLGAPTFAYTIGELLTVDKNGTLNNAGLDDSSTEAMTKRLVELGFEVIIDDEPKGGTTTEEPAHLDVSIPVNAISDSALANLEALVTAKQNLIMKAVGAEKLPILKIGDQIHFPWFNLEATAEESTAYMILIEKLVAFANNAKRVIAKEKETDNEKYAFRCFLLRLGFIGDEYKEARKVLLKNLNGNSAFLSGHKKEAQE